MGNFFDFFSSFIPNWSIIGIFILIIGTFATGVAIWLDWHSERRASDTFGIERRRLAEVNMKVDYNAQITPLQPSPVAGEQAAFMILRLPVENIGDGPVDILAVLITGRLLSAQFKPGLGTRSRDVEWGDFQPLYWNDPDVSQIFLGISTTKDAISAANDYVRLAAKESGVLRRIDAVNNVGALMNLDNIVVRHRVFVVARGYPLGEILRQIGGGPPDPSVNVEQGRLQFQTLAAPNYRRWQTVQQALVNLNRFVFRIAIYDSSHPEESGDPLGFFTDPDAWRIFLLHHWEFVDEAAAAPKEYQQTRAFRQRVRLPNFTEKIAALTEKVKADYPDLVLPPDWQQDLLRLQRVQALCRTELKDFIEVWQRMRAAIDVCKSYKTGQFKGKGYVDEGYPAMIHNAPYYVKALGELDYRERWFALMEEGYLVSKPFHRRIKLFGRPLPWLRWQKYNINKDIPEDPRILEPFVVRTHNFMTAIPTPRQGDEEERKARVL
jgi:hypothetical protein